MSIGKDISVPWHQLRVTEEGGLVFRVQSQSHNAPYYVDLTEPRCDCPQFRCRIAPVLSGRKAAVAGQLLACKHIMAAKIAVANKVIAKMKQTTKTYEGP